jgi:predicted ATPase
MRVSSIRVSGFRTYLDYTSMDELNQVNLFVGRNNSGKSNVLEIFRFLKSLAQNTPYKQPADFISRGRESASIEITFSMEQAERLSITQEILNTNNLPEDIMGSNFLRDLVHSVTISRDGIVRELLQGSNVVEGRFSLWLTENFTVKVPNLDEALKSLSKDSNISVSLREILKFSSPNWVMFTNARKQDLIPQKLKGLYSSIEWVPPFRRSEPTSELRESRHLLENGSNLPQVLNTINGDNPREFVRIEDDVKSIAEIGQILSPPRSNQAIAIVKDSADNAFDLTNSSSGLHEILLLVTKLHTSENCRIILLEEPELHLHASAQRKLRELIQKYSREFQFFITTHSTIFAQNLNGSSLYLVTRNENKSYIKRVQESVDLQNVKIELGHDNTDIYGFNVVVFLEGETEEYALPSMAKILGIDVLTRGIRFQNVRGNRKAERLDQYLRYLKDSGVVPFIIADGDVQLKQKLKEWEGSGLLPAGNHVTWPVEFEDLFRRDILLEYLKDMGLQHLTLETLTDKSGKTSVVRLINRALHETGQERFDKIDLAERLVTKMAVDSSQIPEEVYSALQTILALVDPKEARELYDKIGRKTTYSPLQSIAASLRERGYDARLESELVGKSGATHRFDLTAKKDQVVVAANYSPEPREEDVIGLSAKKYDVDPTFVILLSQRPPTKDEEAVSKAYGVRILSAATGESLSSQIDNLVSLQLSVHEYARIAREDSQFVSEATFRSGGEEFVKPGVCPLCYLLKDKIVVLGESQGRADFYSNPLAIEKFNRHFEEVHNSCWKFLGHQGRATLLLADVSQLKGSPELIDKMYDDLMASFESNSHGFMYRQFESGQLTTDAQAVLVNESGGSDGGSIAFGRVDKADRKRFVEIRILWDDDGLQENDTEFSMFFVCTSSLLNMFDYPIDDIRKAIEANIHT